GGFTVSSANALCAIAKEVIAKEVIAKEVIAKEVIAKEVIAKGAMRKSAIVLATKNRNIIGTLSKSSRFSEKSNCSADLAS
ncbi:MAG: hypothetical protein ACI9HK_004278, partial [Pirellulaceae bacterium]